jgi:hypothetical protein
MNFLVLLATLFLGMLFVYLFFKLAIIAGQSTAKLALKISHKLHAVSATGSKFSSKALTHK